MAFGGRDCRWHKAKVEKISSPSGDRLLHIDDHKEGNQNTSVKSFPEDASSLPGSLFRTKV